MREICALPPSPIHLLSTRKPTVGGGAGFSGAWLPSAWRVLRPLPCALRFSAKATRGPAPGAPVFEPLHLTPDLYPPLDVALYSLLSFFVLLFCVRPRSYGHFTSPTPSMSPCGIFNKIHLLPSKISLKESCLPEREREREKGMLVCSPADHRRFKSDARILFARSLTLVSTSSLPGNLPRPCAVSAP